MIEGIGHKYSYYEALEALRILAGDAITGT
jgi:hypothetical protein